MSWNRKVPFSNGRMLSDENHYQNVEWRAAAEFRARMIYTQSTSGRSSVLHWFKDTETGIEYPICLSNLNQIVPLMHRGVIEGRFIPQKRGQNFNLKVLELYDP